MIPNTGELRDDKKYMSMLEDFLDASKRRRQRHRDWDTLSGGENLGEWTMWNTLKKKLYKSLNIPLSRIETDTGFNMGRASEISRRWIKLPKVY